MKQKGVIIISANNIALVDKGILQSNIKAVKARLKRGTKLCAVVKADAYGHCAAATANALYPYADMFAVALISEGVALRNSGVLKPILVLQPVLACDLDLALRYSLTLTVENLSQLKAIKRAAAKSVKMVQIHIKINTGMNRFGCDNLSELMLMLEFFKKSKNVCLCGIYSHFSDTSDIFSTDMQLQSFIKYANAAKSVFSQITAHISGSGGILLGKKYHLDMVRPGLLLYGYKPFKSDIKVKPALKVYAKALKSLHVKEGERLGYGAFREDADKDVTLLRLGYADGFMRTKFGGENNMLMDAAYIEGQKESAVEILGEEKDADYYAGQWGTISYEVLCSVTRRSEFVFKG